MTPTNQQLLYDKYPQLFINKDKSVMESCMGWGIDVEDGWFDIIDSACYQIAQHENNLKLRKQQYEPIVFDQVKQKFGGLRIYYSGGDEYVRGIISMAEQTSYKTCEVCGNKGRANKNGYIKTVCEVHK